MYKKFQENPGGVVYASRWCDYVCSVVTLHYKALKFFFLS